jgi:ubiquinone/menaquinone biosynthesis C-methylase UbiE
MPPSEVDRIKEAYRRYDAPGGSPHWSLDNPGTAQMHRERERVLNGLLDAWTPPWREGHLLDVGCGTGAVLGALAARGADRLRLHGVDLVAERVARARREHPGIQFREVNAERLPFPDAAFDLVICFTVFSSILDAGMARRVADEVTRVTRVGGGLVWYDFRVAKPWNRATRGMSRAAVADLFPQYAVDLQTLTLLPLLARRLGRRTPTLYPLLARLPFLRTHYIGICRKLSDIPAPTS